MEIKKTKKQWVTPTLIKGLGINNTKSGTSTTGTESAYSHT